MGGGFIGLVNQDGVCAPLPLKITGQYKQYKTDRWKDYPAPDSMDEIAEGRGKY